MMSKTRSSYHKKKKIKLVVVSASIIFAFAIVCFFSFYLLKYYQRGERFRVASEAFCRGDFSKAEALFLVCVKEDNNNEPAWQKLAEIMMSQKRWSTAVSFWGKASSLNRLNEEYQKNLIECRFRAGNYSDVVSIVKNWSHDHQQEYAAIYAIALLRSNRPLPEDSFNMDVLKKDSQIRAKFAVALFNYDKDANVDWSEYIGADDDIVAYEALNQKRQIAIDNNNSDDLKLILMQMAEMNPEVALWQLGDALFFDTNYEGAVKNYRQAMNYRLPIASIVHYIESLYYLGDIEALKKLLPSLQQGTRDIILCGYFLESIIAYMENNVQELGKKLTALNQFKLSPLTALMSFNYGLSVGDATQILNALQDINSNENLTKYKPLAFDKALAFLELEFAKQNIENIGSLAIWMQQRNRNNLMLDRIVLLYKSGDSSIPPIYDIERSMKKYPSDPVLLELAATHYINSNEYAKALQCIQRNLEQANPPLQIFLQEVSALEGMNQTDEAIKKYRDLMQKFPDNMTLNKQYLGFCLRKKLSIDNFSSPVVPEKILTGEKALRSGDNQTMIAAFSAPELLKILDENFEEDLFLLYYMAQRLAEADSVEPAILLYKKIIPVFSNPALIQLNLSELYAAKGDHKNALSFAHDAQLKNYGNPVISGCLGLRQAEAGQYRNAINTLTPLLKLRSIDPRISDVWRGAMEKMIQKHFEDQKFSDCIELSGSLLKVFPNNAIGKEYLSRASVEQQKQQEK